MQRRRSKLPDGQSKRLLLRLTGLFLLVMLTFGIFATYEVAALGLPPLGEMPPMFGPFQLLQSAAAVALAALIVWTIYQERVPSALAENQLSRADKAVASAVVVIALVSTALFLVAPAVFGATAQEDQFIEWISTILLFIACAMFLRSGLRTTRAGPKGMAAVALLLAILFFVMAMEEISWMQRVIGFSTPQDLEQVNWQGEFNFHNVQTDLFENAYYVGSGLFLTLLPFMAETLSWVEELGDLSAFVPSRRVAAAGAAASGFNYGMWNVLPQQLTMMIAVLVMILYARAAYARRDQREFGLFATLATALVASQALFLAFGNSMPDIWDASEYKELFIAIGFAVWAWDVSSRTTPPEGVPR